jgi:hypothetical protein
MESITGKRQNKQVSRIVGGRGEDRVKTISGSPRREREREGEQKLFRSKEGIEGMDEGSKQLPTDNYVWEALRASVAEGASSNVGDRALEPGASCPGIVKGANAQRSKVRRATISEDLNVISDLLEGNMGIEVLESPSGESAVHKVLDRRGMQDFVKNAKRQFLRFGRFGTQGHHKSFEDRLTQRRAG